MPITVHGRGSFLPWRRCDMLCTSGFVDEMIFHIIVQRRVMCIAKLR